MAKKDSIPDQLSPEEAWRLQDELTEFKGEIQKKTEEYQHLIRQLEESRNNFEFLFEHTGTANAFFNLDGILVFQNSMSAAYLNGKPEDFLGKHMKDIFGEKQGAVVLDRFHSVVRNKKSEIYETSFILPSGKKWFSTTYRPVWDSEDVLIGIQIISKDITTEKETWEKLEESRKAYSDLVEMTSDLITKVDQEGRFLYVNHAVHNIYGLSPEQCIGRFAFDFIHPDDRERTTNSFLEWIKSDQSHFAYTNRQLHQDGTSRIMQWNITLNRDDEGTLLSISSIARDITEQSKLENALLQAKYEAETNEKLLKRIQQIAKMGTFRHFLDEGRTEWSANLAEIMGLEPGTEDSLSVEDLLRQVYPDDEAGLMAQFKELVNRRDSQHFSFRVQSQIGGIRYLSFYGETIQDKNGKPTEIIGALQDITDIKSIEQQLRQAKQKAEESDRLKSAFLANMSHEIRTPMNGILGFADILINGDLSDEEQVRFVSIIRSSSEHLLNIISDIVDISKIESDQIDLTFTRFSIDDFFASLLSQTEIYRDSRNKGSLDIAYKIINDLSEVSTDRNRLNQIFMNLLTNAVKFTDEGQILFTAEKIENDRYRFSVQDTGCGIAPEHHRIVFERFRQVQDDNFEGGTGLGLAIASLLVERLGGTLTLNSSVGEGSRFFFDINCADCKEMTERPITVAGTKPPAGGAWKIVVAEDEAVNFHYIRIILEKSGCKVFHAINGKEALELVESENPDFVLMDIKMPVMGGFESLAELRKRGSSVPVIATTAYALAGDKQKALSAGFNGYLSKPFLKNELLKLLASLAR